MQNISSPMNPILMPWQNIQSLYKRGFNNSNINYKMGICYLKITGKKKSQLPILKSL